MSRASGAIPNGGAFRERRGRFWNAAFKIGVLRLGRQASGNEHTEGDHRRRNDTAYERNHLILSQLYRSVILRPAEVVPGLIPRPAWRVWTSVRRDRFVLPQPEDSRIVVRSTKVHALEAAIAPHRPGGNEDVDPLIGGEHDDVGEAAVDQDLHSGGRGGARVDRELERAAGDEHRRVSHAFPVADAVGGDAPA